LIGPVVAAGALPLAEGEFGVADGLLLDADGLLLDADGLLDVVGWVLPVHAKSANPIAKTINITNTFFMCSSLFKMYFCNYCVPCVRSAIL